MKNPLPSRQQEQQKLNISARPRFWDYQNSETAVRASNKDIRCSALPFWRLQDIQPERLRRTPPPRKGLIMAGYNYGYHRDKMEKEFAQIAATCRAEGIAEDTIGIIHRILLNELNSNRKFYTHTQSYDGMKLQNGSDVDVGNNPLLKNYLEQFSAPQVEIYEWHYMAWLDDIDTPEIVEWLRTLREGDILLLTLLVVNDLKQTEAAKILEKHDSAISRKMKQLRESLAKVLPEPLRKRYIR